MSEQYNSKQDRADAINTVKDFVTVDAKGRAHIPAGSGSEHSGNFLSDHELKMIEAHEAQIHGGMANKMSEDILEAVGSLTDPTEIRDSLYVHGYLDDDEVKTWNDSDVLSYVNDTRSEVENYYLENVSKDTSESNESTDEYVPKHRADTAAVVQAQAPEQYVGRHAATNTDEDSPIFNELNAKVRDNESLEEYEARQHLPTAGRHRFERASAEGLDIDEAPAEGKFTRASAEGLDIETPLVDAYHEALAEQEAQPIKARSRRERMRDLFTAAGFATEVARLSSAAKEKLGKHKKAKLALGILAVGGGIAAYYLTKDSGHTPTNSNGGGTGPSIFKDIFDVNVPEQPSGPSTGGSHELFNSGAWNIPKGSGGEALMERLGADKTVWYEHQDEFLKLFPSDAYRMDDGNVGFDDPGRLSKGAIKYWSRFAK